MWCQALNIDDFFLLTNGATKQHVRVSVGELGQYGLRPAVCSVAPIGTPSPHLLPTVVANIDTIIFALLILVALFIGLNPLLRECLKDLRAKK